MPYELHQHIASLLHPATLSDLCLASRKAYDLYSDARDARVSIDGTLEAERFFKANRRTLDATLRRENRCIHGQHGRSIKTVAGSDVAQDQQNKARISNRGPRGLRIHQLKLFDVRPFQSEVVNGEVVFRNIPFIPVSLIHDDLKRATCPDLATLPRNLVEAAISVCPNLRELSTLQSVVPLDEHLARLMSLRTPRLRSLTFQSWQADTAATAILLRGLPNLEMLHVMSMKTCPCRGPKATREAALEVGLAIRNHPKLKKVVFNGCKALKVEKGLLMRVLAGLEHRKDCRNAGHHHGHHQGNDSYQQVSSSTMEPDSPSTPVQAFTGLISLELRRCPLPGDCLLSYLVSPFASHLDHLFIGGCRKVHADDLKEATSSGSPSRAGQAAKKPVGIVASRRGLNLEIDGRLLSKELLENLDHRLTTLRIFEPNQRHLQILVAAISQKERLGRLESLTILPLETEVDGYVEPKGQFRQLLLDGFVAGGKHVDLRIGDESWWQVKEWKQSMRLAQS